MVALPSWWGVSAAAELQPSEAAPSACASHSLGRCLWKGGTVALGCGVRRAVCITDGGMERVGAEQRLSSRLGLARTSPLGSCFLCGDVFSDDPSYTSYKGGVV